MEEPKKYCTILIKRRTTGEPGPPENLMPGELAFNEVDRTLYIGKSVNVSISSTQP